VVAKVSWTQIIRYNMKLFLKSACLLAVTSLNAGTVINQTTSFTAYDTLNAQPYVYTTDDSSYWHLDTLVFSGIGTQDSQFQINVADYTVTFWEEWSETIPVGNVVTASTAGPLTSIGSGFYNFDLTFDLSTANIIYGSGTAINFSIQTETAPLWTIGGDLTNDNNSIGWEQNGSFKTPMILSVTAVPSPTVPEPSTYGLVLGGLALCVAGIRRRRKVAA
jgi:hypothetical protein